MRQILLNLLGNAVKFTDRGRVTLKVSTIGTIKLPEPETLFQTTLRFEVSDTGVGIAPQDIEKIFQPFEQVGNVKRRTEGTGLGLSITQQLIELMGTQLHLTSELGKGSTFWFDLTVPVVRVSEVQPLSVSPVAAVPQFEPNGADAKNLDGESNGVTPIIENSKTEARSTSLSAATGYKGRQRKLLVVDDRIENRVLLANILEPLGFEAIVAENGKQGLELACQNQIDLILTDILMDIKTGLTMVRELRQMPQFQTMPIVAISASIYDMMEPRSLEAGCNAFLPKPIDEEKLLSLLQQ
ncbi:ATP-binding protein [Pleurocapsa sp. PCC 7327]|uniref:ATP-binding protein n=1 Tax=Pleurocapsa sp. PCC 7327 TaxID=118163 RepID=UPI0002DD3F5A|nr:ATP-binding protein [Pleurocapsa sp. PCC 7327]